MVVCLFTDSGPVLKRRRGVARGGRYRQTRGTGGQRGWGEKYQAVAFLATERHEAHQRVDHWSGRRSALAGMCFFNKIIIDL